jgi:uncharacterized membrane protein
LSPLRLDLRGLHVVLGFAALAAGLVPLVTRKGGRAHRLSGRVYLFGLGAAAGTAAALAARRGDLFMLSLAVLTLYFLVTGRRALHWDRPGLADRALAVLLLALSAASALWQLARPPGEWGAMTVVGVVFGLLGAANAGRDLRLLRRLAAGGRVGIFEHFMRMIASYIAASTAFSVTNLRGLPVLVRWLWPTVAGTLLITAIASRLASRAAGGAEEPTAPLDQTPPSGIHSPP